MDVVVVENPWRCLCLGFRLQVTYRRFLRFTTRQSLHKRRTADLTRILLKLFAMLDGLIRRGGAKWAQMFSEHWTPVREGCKDSHVVDVVDDDYPWNILRSRVAAWHSVVRRLVCLRDKDCCESGGANRKDFQQKFRVVCWQNKIWPANCQFIVYPSVPCPPSSNVHHPSSLTTHTVHVSAVLFIFFRWI